jgi:tRNA threonylcarbamoyladenosine biosynthesis protein TsaE
MDLYRLADAEELEYLGVRDLADGDATLLVEWPEQGAGNLPPADIVIELRYRDHAREAEVQSRSALGEAALASLP